MPVITIRQNANKALAAAILVIAAVFTSACGSTPTSPSTVASVFSSTFSLTADGRAVTNELPYTVGRLVASGTIIRPAGDTSKVTVAAAISFGGIMTDIVQKDAKDYTPNEEGVLTMDGDNWTWVSNNYTPCAYPFFNSKSPVVDCHTQSLGLFVTLTVNGQTQPAIKTGLGTKLVPTKWG